MNRKKLKLITRIFFYYFSLFFTVNYLTGTVLKHPNLLLYALSSSLTIASLLTLLQLYAVPSICREELRKGKELEELKMCRAFKEAGFRI
jgi:antibiotic biosynthesis monooxygenase (ABM) superfamily enzyme